MKKHIALILAMTVVLTIGITAFADDTGIQMIGGPAATEEEESVNLDDFKVGDVAHISGLGDVELVRVEWIDEFYYGEYFLDWCKFKSGAEAEYLRLTVRILNTSQKAKNYLPMIDNIICDYGDGYQFGGWKRQLSADIDKTGYDDNLAYEEETETYDISPLYAGRYYVVITLPNVCVDSKEPLSVSFTIGDSDFTYIHHK